MWNDAGVVCAHRGSRCTVTALVYCSSCVGRCGDPCPKKVSSSRFLCSSGCEWGMAFVGNLVPEDVNVVRQSTYYTLVVPMCYMTTMFGASGKSRRGTYCSCIQLPGDLCRAKWWSRRRQPENTRVSCFCRFGRPVTDITRRWTSVVEGGRRRVQGR
jgi:hypothetical protein